MPLSSLLGCPCPLQGAEDQEQQARGLELGQRYVPTFFLTPYLNAALLTDQ